MPSDASPKPEQQVGLTKIMNHDVTNPIRTKRLLSVDSAQIDAAIGTGRAVATVRGAIGAARRRSAGVRQLALTRAVDALCALAQCIARCIACDRWRHWRC
jgi:hypothetical protein